MLLTKEDPHGKGSKYRTTEQNRVGWGGQWPPVIRAHPHTVDSLVTILMVRALNMVPATLNRENPKPRTRNMEWTSSRDACRVSSPVPLNIILRYCKWRSLRVGTFDRSEPKQHILHDLIDSGHHPSEYTSRWPSWNPSQVRAMPDPSRDARK